MKKFISFVTFCLMIVAGTLFTSCLNGEDEIPDVYENLEPGRAIVATVNMTNDSHFEESELKAIAEIVNKLAEEIKKRSFTGGDDIIALCKTSLKNGVEDLPDATQITLKKYACEIGLFGYFLTPDSKQLTFTFIYNCEKELPNVEVPSDWKK